MEKGQKCSVKVWGRNYRQQCSKLARVERHGIPYCTIHDPVGVKEREEKLNAAAEERYQQILRGQKEKAERRELLKRNLIALMEGHRVKCPDCKVSPSLILDLAEKAGLRFTDEEKKLFA